MFVYRVIWFSNSLLSPSVSSDVIQGGVSNEINEFYSFMLKIEEMTENMRYSLPVRSITNIILQALERSNDMVDRKSMIDLRCQQLMNVWIYEYLDRKDQGNFKGFDETVRDLLVFMHSHGIDIGQQDKWFRRVQHSNQN